MKKKKSRKKPAKDLTTEAVMRRIFPKEVRVEAKEEVKETGKRRGSTPNKAEDR